MSDIFLKCIICKDIGHFFSKVLKRNVEILICKYDFDLNIALQCLKCKESNMEKKYKSEEREKPINNEHEQYVQKGDNVNALNTFVRQMGLRPSSKTYTRCYSNS